MNELSTSHFNRSNHNLIKGCSNYQIFPVTKFFNLYDSSVISENMMKTGFERCVSFAARWEMRDERRWPPTLL
jgi:hypothetical protein